MYLTYLRYIKHSRVMLVITRKICHYQLQQNLINIILFKCLKTHQAKLVYFILWEM